MKRLGYLLLGTILFSCGRDTKAPKEMNAFVESHQSAHVIVIHGGAGSRVPGNDQEDAHYLASLERVLAFGDSLLSSGVSAVEVVERCIRLLEDDSLFNAGRGAVFAADGTNRLDASIMDGNTMNAGAVAGVSRIKNPISLARAIMDSSAHVLLSGEEAEEFAQHQGIEMVDPSYFFTHTKFEYLRKVQAKEKVKDEKHGTVGCVVLDKNGHLAAGTSTGGMTNKKYGRIGDSPIIGAGTYAEDSVCAVSATGHGEYFIRYVVAHDIAARMKYGQFDLDSASHYVINKQLMEIGGMGGVICVDNAGNISMPFNTSAMFRGYMRAGKKPVVMIYPE